MLGGVGAGYFRGGVVFIRTGREGGFFPWEKLIPKIKLVVFPQLGKALFVHIIAHAFPPGGGEEGKLLFGCQHETNVRPQPRTARVLHIRRHVGGQQKAEAHGVNVGETTFTAVEPIGGDGGSIPALLALHEQAQIFLRTGAIRRLTAPIAPNSPRR